MKEKENAKIKELKNKLGLDEVLNIKEGKPESITYKDKYGNECLLYSFEIDRFNEQELNKCLSIEEMYFLKEAIEDYKKITVAELEEGLKAVDSLIELLKNVDGVPLMITYVELNSDTHMLYSFVSDKWANFKFMLDRLGQDEINELIKLVFAYKYGSNDFKRKNSSTMPFEDDISNDSQKKPVLSGLYTKKEVDSTLKKYTKKQENIENELKELGLESNEKIKRHFIDYLLDNCFNPRIQTMLGETTKIEILDPTLTLICTIDFSKEESVSLNISGTKDADFLKMLIGLSANILQMLKDLDHFKQLNQLKEDDDGK